jgi:hypothetical protein
MTAEPVEDSWPSLRRPAEAVVLARVRGNLHEIAIDIVGRCEHDELSAEEKEILHEAMASAVDEVTADLLERFEFALDERLRSVPPHLRGRLFQALTRASLGID